MRYIHTLEEKKFKEEKEKENELLRKFGVDEKIIQELYDGLIGYSKKWKIMWKGYISGLKIVVYFRPWSTSLPKAGDD